MNEAKAKQSGNFIVNYFKDFGVLRETRSEYWGIQVINILDSTVFFAVLTIAVVLLSEDFGFSDINAGYVVTLYASLTTICLLFSGMVTDWLGVRKSFYVSQVGLLITRGAIVLVALKPDLLPEYREAIVTVAFGLMAPFVAMVITVFQAANKRYTSGRSRSAGFNLWYLFMNVGAAAGGYLIDVVRLHLEWDNVHIFTIGCGAAVACMVVNFFTVRREDQFYGPGERAPETSEADLDRPKKKNPWEIMVAVLRETTFWKFVVLITLLLGVRAVFLYMHLLMPKFWLRVIGPDAQIGALEVVNPIAVIIGLIVLIPILHRFSVYGMLVYGSMISALSLFIMAIPGTGNDIYLYSIIALLVLTVGEVIWSPRLTEYTAAIAPVGQEGTYLGLSMVPYFLAKTLVGLMSGHMLHRWVPEYPEGEPILAERLAAGEISFWDSPSAMWIILAIPALLGPLVALLLKGWFTKGAHWGKKAEEKSVQSAVTAPDAVGGSDE